MKHLNKLARLLLNITYVFIQVLFICLEATNQLYWDWWIVFIPTFIYDLFIIYSIIKGEDQ